MEVDSVFACNNISDGGSGGLGRGLLGLRRHVCDGLGGSNLLGSAVEYALEKWTYWRVSRLVVDGSVVEL